MEGRRPTSALDGIHRGDILQEPEYIKKKLRDMNPDQGGSLGLGVAVVVDVDFEEHFVTLRTVIGTEQEFQRVPVPITYPGAGARHFLGAMPEVGDTCVVGWLPQESSEDFGGSKTPVILTWIIPGVWPGRDWLTTANFTEDEHDADTSRNREEIRGTFDRIRHKLRHIQPGNIVGSSSQGADLVLDESILLANRRGNEFILRDADQAAVLRALQQFIALAGTRTYSGMVQRDALRLPTQVFSDGGRWDGPQQSLAGEAIHAEDLPPHETSPDGRLVPAFPLDRTVDSVEGLSSALVNLQADLDPFVFLRNGGYIDEEGNAVDEKHISDAAYAGKNIYRVLPPDGTGSNAVVHPGVGALTEHRLEITHTSNGRLPVTEQTDGFDAERMPPSDPDTPGSAENRPFIEHVMGSVVGNDPFTTRGRAEYGIPLIARIFDDTGGLGPRVEGVRIPTFGQAGGTPVDEHAATLFKLTPISGRLAPTFWSVNKKGQVHINISGPPTGHSLDVAVAGHMRFAGGGGLFLQIKGGLHFETRSTNPLRLKSNEGPVYIYGGGPGTEEERSLERIFNVDGGEAAVPSIDIHARTNARLRAEKRVLVKGNSIELNAQSVKVNAHDEFELATSKQITLATEDLKCLVSGKRTDNFTGPKQLNPTNGALHERNYNSNFPGVAEEVDYGLSGSRKETFTVGDHSTSIKVGDMTYETTLGAWKAQAGLNKLEVATAAGITGQAVVGNVQLTASVGAAMMKGLSAVVIEATGGPLHAKSSSLIVLQSPGNGPDIGPIICAGSREPFTNLPFLTWGLGAKTTLVV